MDERDRPSAGELYVVGLGPGDSLQLPGINLSLMRGRQVYVRTGRHPLAPFLEREGIRLKPLDDFYERYSSFDEVYREMAAWLISAAAGSRQPVVFAVPGHPLVGETVVGILLRRAPSRGVRVRLWPAPSFVDAVCLSLRLDPADGLVVMESFQMLRRLEVGQASRVAMPADSPPFSVPPQAGVLVAQVYSRALASEVKLTLMEYFPDDHPLTVIRSAGVRGQERLFRIPLYELDRLDDLDHLTTVYAQPLQPQPRVMPAPDTPGADNDTGLTAMATAGMVMHSQPPDPPQAVNGQPPRYPLDPLVTVMERLLAPGGCPWDRQQTHQSLRKYLIEEAYEVIDAIDEGNMHKLCEELGDLLLQIVFHAALANDRGEFDINQVVAEIAAKLKRRHPHVFGEITVNNAAEVVQNWEAIKRSERMAGETGTRAGERPRSLLAGAPRHLPALQRAQMAQGKAALVGFDWPDAKSATAKLGEEWRELRAAWAEEDEEAVSREMGDLLFACVNVARLLGVNAEEALRSAADKFMRRFQAIETKADARGLDLQVLTLQELDAIWDEVKAEEIANG